MQNLFDSVDREAIVRRLTALRPGSPRQWGKMSPAQMLAHCAAALEVACGDRPKKQTLLGRIVTPFIRSSILGEKPFGRNSPTDPDFVIADERDFALERRRLGALIDRFCERGSSAAAGQVHSFFGRLSGDEWGRLMHKHLDHHLRQFGE
jgi:hypothetical protein